MSAKTKPQRPLIRQIADKAHVPPHLVEAHMLRESGRDDLAPNNSGAAGFMWIFVLVWRQLTEKWTGVGLDARLNQAIQDPRDPEADIGIATDIMALRISKLFRTRV